MKLDALTQCRRVVLLQGPIGPFFKRLAAHIEAAGGQTSKINFNGGDDHFFPNAAYRFQGTPEDWPAYLAEVLEETKCDALVLYGDCRPYHVAAKRIAQQHNVAVWVFEEGYIRPNYVTLEQGGVNGHSLLPQSSAFYDLQIAKKPMTQPLETNAKFWSMARLCMRYYLFGHLNAWRYPDYRHHRNFSVLKECSVWLKAGWRRLKDLAQRHASRITELAETQWAKQYYFVPLQVYNDSQVAYHSKFGTVRRFIEEIIGSFAQHAPPHTQLIIKQHPLDIGAVNYTALIRQLSEQGGVADRVHYLCAGKTPVLLRHALGTLTINSTVGLSSLYHNTPVKALGSAIYNIEGLTHQGPLDTFWATPGVIDRLRFLKFYEYIIVKTQVNGSFYADFPAMAPAGAGALPTPVASA